MSRRSGLVKKVLRLRRLPTELVATAVLAFVLGTVFLPPPSASAFDLEEQEAAQATVAYWTEAGVSVADALGREIRRFSDFDHFSFAGSLLAGERPGTRHSSDRIVGYDISSGDRLFRIANATNPVVTASGGRVAFLPTFRREEYVKSVWMRMAGGTVRKVAQFRAGPGLPGISHGMKGDGGPLDIALDERGRFMAVAFGLEPLRAFDVWIVDTKTREATRMTRGRNSHNPSLSPDGKQLAVRVERSESCPDPIYGEILVGKVRVISRETGEQRTLTEVSCDVFYDTPRWIDNETLLAVRVTKDPRVASGYDLDVVRIDPESGAITDEITEGNPCCLTTSPSLGRVAFAFSDRPGFAVLDLRTGTTTDFTGDSYVPHLGGESRF